MKDNAMIAAKHLIAAIITMAFSVPAALSMPLTGNKPCDNDPFKDIKEQVTLFKNTLPKEANVEKNPWRSVGKLEQIRPNGDKWDLISTCTATLIGKKHALTAAHCVNSFKQGDAVQFAPQSTDGHAPELAYVTKITAVTGQRKANDKYDYAAKDWAIVELSEPLGETFGWLPVMSVSSKELSQMKLSAAGYSSGYMDGKRLGVSRGCSIRKVRDDGVALADCSYTQGASGGPIITSDADGNPVIVGIAIAAKTATDQDGAPVPVRADTYSDEDANWILPSAAFASAIKTTVK